MKADDRLVGIFEPFEERMAQVLENPRYDPHGAPIPTHDLELPSQSHQKLSELRTGQQAVIQRVPDDDPELLRYLQNEGITPHSRIKVTGYTSFDNNLKIRVLDREQTIVLGPNISEQIFVDLEDLSV